MSFNTSKDYNEVSKVKVINSPDDYLHGLSVVEGEPYGTFYAFDFAGLDGETGYPTFNGLEKDATPDDFRDYLVKAGCTEPDVSGGISTSLRYKKVTLRAQFAMQLGAQAYLPAYFASGGAPRSDQNVPRYMFDRWRQPGDELTTDIPAIPGRLSEMWYTNADGQLGLPYGLGTYSATIYQMYNLSTARVADTDFIRCRNISVQYDVPHEWTSQVGIRNAYASLSLTNPFFIAFDKAWKGRDPETANWPARRSLSFNLNITF